MTNNARIGGILSIVAGAFGCLFALGGVFGAALLGVFSGTAYYDNAYDIVASEEFLVGLAIFYGFLALIGLAVSVLAIVGGVYGIKKKGWGLALAGSIAAVLAFFPCGIPAVIFTILGKPEFTTLQPGVPARPQT